MFAIRNRTNEFKQLRADIRRRRERFGGFPEPTLNQKLLSVELTTRRQTSVTCPWQEDLEAARAKIDALKQKVSALERFRKQSVLSLFNEDEGMQREAVILRNQITTEVGHCDQQIQRLRIGHPDDPSDVKVLRLNAARSVAAALQECVNELKKIHFEGAPLRKRAPDTDLGDEERGISKQATANQGIQQQQVLGLMEAQTWTGEFLSEETLAEMERTVAEIQLLFQHSSALVIEQGSAVDRIDYNMDNALSYAEKTRQVLLKVEKTQKTGFAKQATMLLLVLNAICFCLVCLKYF